MVLWQQIFLHFGADDFPFKLPFKSAAKSSFSASASRSSFGAAVSVAAARSYVVLLCFATQCLQMMAVE